MQTSTPHQHPAAADPDAATVLSPEAFGTTLLVWALDRLGPHLINPADPDDPPDPAVIRAECEEALGRPLPNASFDRLMAAREVTTSDAFRTSVPDFSELCNVLCGAPFDPTTFEPPEPVEIGWAVTEAALLDSPDPGETYLSPEVVGFIAHTLKGHGFLTAPTCLSAAAGELSRASDEAAASASDDPTTFAAVWQRRREKADAVDDAVRDALGRLLDQVGSLRLRHGNVTDLKNRILKDLTENQTRSR